MSKFKDLALPMGSYTDVRSGEQKTEWQNCGEVLRLKDDRTGEFKFVVKIDTVFLSPTVVLALMKQKKGGVGRSVLISCFEPRDAAGAGGGATAAAAGAGSGGGGQGQATPPAEKPLDDDEIPF